MVAIKSSKKYLGEKYTTLEQKCIALTMRELTKSASDSVMKKYPNHQKNSP